MAEEEPNRLNLDVYDSGEGYWNPEHGEMTIPETWEFLPSGDAFMTRAVKAAGVYWVVWRPRGRDRPHRRLLGVLAPTTAIAQAHAVAEETAAARERSRERGARQRARAEDHYRDQLATAIFEFLSFSDVHEDLAAQIAHEASAHTVAVGSGRVGRTHTLPLAKRAALAARAFIRHRFTDYEDLLETSYGEEFLLDELEYRGIKSGANQAVDEFLARHRTPSGVQDE